MVVAKLLCVATTNFKSLQRNHVTIVMQSTRLVYMNTYMLHEVDTEGPF